MPDPRAALPADAVLLHIGPHKTGTTAIQGLLNTGREDLAARAVTYPGRWSAHHQAARSLLGEGPGWPEDPGPVPDDAHWRRLVQETTRSAGRVVVSSEYFARCDADRRARVVRDLGPERLHLLVAARNPGSIALSMWQQDMREGRTGRLDDWLDDQFRRPAPGRAQAGFWAWADAATLVEDWSEVLDLDRIHVVMIDEADRTLLPTTFEQLLDLPPGLLSRRTPPRQNRGLTAPEAELIRTAIALGRPGLSWDEFSLYFRTGVASRLHEVRVPPPTESRPALPSWATTQAEAEADSTIERLRSSGVDVIGDLDHLRRIPAAGVAPDITEVPVDLAAEALAGVIAAAQQRIRSLAERADRVPALQRRLRAARARTAAPDTGRAPTLEDASARELAAALRARIRARLRSGGSGRDGARRDHGTR